MKKQSLFSVDLERLSDDNYMDTITSTPNWHRLEIHMRTIFLMDLLNQLRRLDENNDEIRDKIVDAFLAELTEEDKEEIASTLEANEFLGVLSVSGRFDRKK